MYRNPYATTGKLLLGVIIAVVLLQYFEETIILIVGIVLLVGIITYNLLFNSNKDILLEELCHPDQYLEHVEKAYKDKDVLLKLHKAYALFYLDNEEARTLLHSIDYFSLDKPKHQFIYHSLQLKFLYEDNNKEMYYEELSSFLKTGLPRTFQVPKEVFEIPLFMMREEYETAIQILIEIIPGVSKKYLVYELEYYLAECYIKINKKEDAIAVLEFVASKTMNFSYIYKCRKRLEEIK